MVRLFAPVFALAILVATGLVLLSTTDTIWNLYGFIIVVGAGISGLQLALAIAEKNDRPVTLVSEHPIRTSPFDFNPCWIGPKCMSRFMGTPLPRRRGLIDTVRRPGREQIHRRVKIRTVVQ